MSMELISGTSELYTREDGSLVTSWCNRFDKRVFSDLEKRERMGVVDFPADVVRAADAGVPTDYESAKAAGFTVGARYSFASARSFLREAARSTYGIRGYD